MYILDGRKLLSLPNLNSSPIDELGNWCQERLVGRPAQVLGTAGRFPWRPCERESALPAATNQHRHLPNTYLGQTSNKGGKGLGRKFLAKHCSNTAIIAKLQQMANTADLSAHGEANPCGHPACIFFRKTAGRIDSRLTLPKLNLATLSHWMPYMN